MDVKIKHWAIVCFALGAFVVIAIYALAFFGWMPPILGLKMHARLIIVAFAFSFGFFCAGVFAFKVKIKDAESCALPVALIVVFSILILMEWLIPG